MANRIHSKGDARREEFIAATSTIYPGMLLTQLEAGTVTPHATEGGRSEAMFAEEDALQGKNDSTLYTIANPVSVLLPAKGSEVRALIESGQEVVIGDELISAGNGKLKVAGDLESGETLTQVIAIAAEARDLTGSGASDTISRVRIV